ncbi:MAG: hypothetical protein U0894_01160 [Pirellulales bacterium]
MSLDRETLLGYLLGALDPSEQNRVEQLLAEDPRLREEVGRLRKVLDEMGLGDEPEAVEPPPQLAARTVDAVLESDPSEVAAALTPVPSPRVELGPLPQHYRLADWLMLAILLLAAVGLVFPVVLDARDRSRRLTCEDHLRALGQALHEYGQLHPDHRFPEVAPQGNRGVAGVYAPKLLSNQLIDNPSLFICPSSTLGEARGRWRVPTLQELDEAIGSTLVVYQQTMGGSYGYHLGRIDSEGRIVPASDLRRSNFVLAGDAPNPKGPLLRSMNHGIRGQNFLYEDGRVKFVVTVLSTEDDPFVNEQGVPAAGTSDGDAVLGASSQRPLPDAFIAPRK